MLVEMSARPMPARAVEWTIALALRNTVGRARRYGMSITVGPMQMSGAPWPRRAAVTHARNLLLKADVDLSAPREVAMLWNGRRSACSGAFPYVDALVIGYLLAARLVSAS